MALLLPVAPPPALGRSPALVAPAAALAVALAATGWLARTALTADAGPILDTAATPVAVRVTGELDTAGLAGGGTTASTLTVTNAGDRPLRWALVPQVAGTPEVATALTVAARPGRCPSGGERSTAAVTAPGALSPEPLVPGSSTPVCVLLTLPASAAAVPGTLDVSVGIRATPA